MVRSLESEIIQVKKYMQSEFMYTNDEWLSGCVEFFRSERGSRHYTERELNEMVKGQWILADLKDISPGCLPPNLANQVKVTLPGVYVLQMNYFIDISEPAYQQLQALKKVDITNIEATSYEKEPTAKRMLKLNFTDGVQEINGIEYRPMRNLSHLVPGTKMKIKGPVVCRRGLLMLEEQQVSLLGGEVDELIIDNSCQNIIARKVNSNAEHQGITSENVARQFEITSYNPRNIQMAIVNPLPNSQHSNNQHNANFLSNNDNVAAQHMLDDEMFDDDFNMEQLDALENMAVPTNSNNQRNNHSPQQNAAKKIKMSTESCRNNENDYPSSGENIELLQHDNNWERNSFSNDANPQQNEAENHYVENNYDPFYDDDFESCFVEPDDRSIVDKPTHILIKNVQEQIKDDVLESKFVVKARISGLLNKLSLRRDRWELRCTLTDDSGFLDVDVGSDVLSEIIGITPQEANMMKTQFISNVRIKEKFLQSLAQAREKLMTLNCILHVEKLSAGLCVMKTEDS